MQLFQISSAHSLAHVITAMPSTNVLLEMITVTKMRLAKTMTDASATMISAEIEHLAVTLMNVQTAKIIAILMLLILNERSFFSRQSHLFLYRRMCKWFR